MQAEVKMKHKVMIARVMAALKRPLRLLCVLRLKFVLIVVGLKKLLFKLMANSEHCGFYYESCREVNKKFFGGLREGSGEWKRIDKTRKKAAS